jgi:hypothetical protein
MRNYASSPRHVAGHPRRWPRQGTRALSEAAGITGSNELVLATLADDTWSADEFLAVHLTLDRCFSIWLRSCRSHELI